jgi:hypothetical protein
MPIGKDSITKRVAKQTEPADKKEKNTAPELVATVGVAPAKTEKKAPAKKTTTAKATTAEKKPAAPKKTAQKPAEAKTVETTVLANVAPETVEKVIGHKENTNFEKVSIGQKLPEFLL